MHVHGPRTRLKQLVSGRVEPHAHTCLGSNLALADLRPTNGGLDGLLPGDAHPFQMLRAELHRVHERGCRLDKIGRYSMPCGTFRRMRSSMGMVHADTATLLSPAAGEFSANIYVRTAEGQGSLCIFPTRQYVGDGGFGGVTSPALLADLQALAARQKEGFRIDAQAYIRKALPLERKLELRDGDLVLLNTGRFHQVEPFDEGDRLSGQCWLSYRSGYPLLMWV